MDYCNLTEEKKEKISKLLFTDLVLLRSDLIHSGNINSEFFYFVESELKRRKEDIGEEKSRGGK